MQAHSAKVSALQATQSVTTTQFSGCEEALCGNEWMWLCANKTLFTKTAGQVGPQAIVANPDASSLPSRNKPFPSPLPAESLGPTAHLPESLNRKWTCWSTLGPKEPRGLGQEPRPTAHPRQPLPGHQEGATCEHRLQPIPTSPPARPPPAWCL